MSIIKRIAAGVLSALTVVSSFPVANAAPTIEELEDGTFKFPIMRAAEDDESSEAEIHPGETYTVWDIGSQTATFLQNGESRDVWPMRSKLKDDAGTIFHVYCGDHTKGNPGGGMDFTVGDKITDMRLYGVLIRSDARNTLNAFVNTADGVIAGATDVLKNENFGEWEYFCASQAAVCAALGDVKIVAGSVDGVTWGSSDSLGYHSDAGKTLSANGKRSALIMYAAIVMLKTSVMFSDV